MFFAPTATHQNWFVALCINLLATFPRYAVSSTQLHAAPPQCWSNMLGTPLMSSPFFPDHSKASALDGPAERARDRDSLMLRAETRLVAKNETIEARVRNLSAGGMMAEANIRVERGDPVEVNLRNVGWVTGKVAWVTENRFGVAFDHPVDPKLVRKPVGQNNEAISVRHTSGERRPDPNKLRRF